MSGSEDSTRPLSVAELLARNGTIGSPPVGGRRRRRRRNSDGVSVAELTGEIPVVRTGEIPVVADDEAEAEYDEAAEDDEAEAEGDEAEDDEAEAEDSEAEGDEAEAEDDEAEYDETETEDDEAEARTRDGQEVCAEEVYTDDVNSSGAPAEVLYLESGDAEIPDSSKAVEKLPAAEVVYASAVQTDEVIVVAPTAVVEEMAPSEPPPRSTDPMPRRSRNSGDLERSHDPRPQRRSSGAEQMSYDPVDQSVDLSELVDQPGGEEARSYLQVPTGILFSGGTVADDLARRGLITAEERPDYTSDFSDSGYSDSEYADSDSEGDQLHPDDHEASYHNDEPAVTSGATVSRPRRFVRGLWNGVAALLQSLLAVVLGAGLFIGFDHLWRLNRLVALVLTVLVVLALAAGVRIVRKTEDIVSTLTAVAVGLLVTLGPLALQST